MPAIWGPVKHPNNYNRGAVADSAIKVIRVLTTKWRPISVIARAVNVTDNQMAINEIYLGLLGVIYNMLFTNLATSCFDYA